MLNIEGTVKEMQAEGTIVEEVTTMENLSLRIMSLLGKHDGLFKMVISGDPKAAYDKAGVALETFVKLDSMKAHHEEAKVLLESYKAVEETLGKDAIGGKEKTKALMSKYLWDAGYNLAKAGAFGVDTASILGLFTARMAAHTVKEAKWAGTEIKKSFMKRFL